MMFAEFSFVVFMIYGVWSIMKIHNLGTENENFDKRIVDLHQRFLQVEMHLKTKEDTSTNRRTMWSK